ncbi:hypothetical protein [Nocardiopsis tropica]|uniref:Uncharacterized protein n=1 Tax=Nocardiopsis tropica TaxID=109330 RepID=A0ABU7KMX9_9ACTN|nr:hypothetical protein [Nocardiopsis umidischolae]MEE2050656.1 hypothetical protein [Nocardiopsis umidischolae]
MKHSASTPVWRRPDWWIAAFTAARHGLGWWRMRRTLTQLNRPAPNIHPPQRARVHVIVPVLWEQPQVEAMVDHYAALLRSGHVHTVTVVTSAREDTERTHLADRLASGPWPPTWHWAAHLTREEHDELDRHHTHRGSLPATVVTEVLKRRPNTADTVTRVLSRANLRGLALAHVHYAGPGRKAAQVNHAVETMPTAERDFIALYDVDSRPGRTVLDATHTLIARHRTRHGAPPQVLQQSALFRTRGESTRGWERAVCRGAARLQSLRTLRREIPALNTYREALHSPVGIPWVDALRCGLAQTVGHGLWVRSDTYRRLGGLPTHTLLDDLPFGYRLTIERIPVEPVPSTLTAAAPETLPELLAQGQRWFHNYLDYPLCALQASRAQNGTPLARTTALAVGGYRGAAWLLRSPAVIACAALAVRPASPWPVRITAAGALWLAIAAPARTLASHEGRSLTPRAQARECTELASGYLLSSVGPLIATARHLINPRRDTEGISPKSNTIRQKRSR